MLQRPRFYNILLSSRKDFRSNLRLINSDVTRNTNLLKNDINFSAMDLIPLKKWDSRIAFFWIFSCCLSLASSWGQHSKIFFHQLNINGTPFTKSVNCLLQDEYGFLWIGTDEGLYQYNGNELAVYQNDAFNEQSISNNTVTKLAEDGLGNLWIGMESYLNHFDHASHTFEYIYKKSVRSAFRDSQGNNWIGVKKRGLSLVKARSEGGTPSLVTDFNYQLLPAEFLLNKEIFSINEDQSGRIWLATRQGLFYVDKDHIVRPSNITQGVLNIFSVEDYFLMIRSDNTILRIGRDIAEPNQIQVIEKNTAFVGQAILINAIEEDANQTLWMGTSKGLFLGQKLKDHWLKHFTKVALKENVKGDLPSQKISAILRDKNDNIWIGTAKGLAKVNARSALFETNNLKTELPSDDNHEINTIYFDPQHNLWIAVEGKGVLKRTSPESTFQRIELPANSIQRIKQSSTEDLLLTSNTHLFKLLADGKTTTIYQHQTGEQRNAIVDFLDMGEGEYWIGLWDQGLLIVSDESKLDNFRSEIRDRLTGFNISIFYKDKQGLIWIGTRGDGLVRIDLENKQFKHYLPSTETGLNSQAIICIFEDSRQKLWLGTRSGGISLYDAHTDRFETYTKSDGLPSNTISAIVEDNKQQIWVSTSDGLAKFTEKENPAFISFGLEDGLINKKFNYKAGALDPQNGRIYFGSSDGYTCVNTSLFQYSDLTAITAITEVKIHQKANEVRHLQLAPHASTAFDLNYQENNISISFSALELTAPNKVQYAYQMDGVNDYWIYTDASNRTANYNKLPHGQYRFKVKSTNSDGLWNDQPTTFAFIIHPPFWLTTSAYILYSLLSLLLIGFSFFIIRRWYRLKQELVLESMSRTQEQQVNKMRMVFFTNISHELRTPLTLILGSIEKVMNSDNFRIGPDTSRRIHNNALRIRRMINQMLDLRKHDVGELRLQVQKGNLIAAIQQIKNAFNDYADKKEIEFRIKTGEDKIKGYYSREVLEKILFNLLSNAFKFTPVKGTIKIMLEVVKAQELAPELALSPIQASDKYFKCTVLDNGIGISEKDQQFIFDRFYQASDLPDNPLMGTGIGMELVKKLTALHHGAITLQSELNEYTEISVYLPLSKKYYKEDIFLSQPPASKIKPQSPKIPILPPKVRIEPANKVKYHQATILVVEDNEELRHMIVTALGAFYNVKEACNGKEGYEMAVQKSPDLILSDIMMPVEDGMSLLKKIKTNPDTAHLPFFMLTAKVAYDVKIESVSLGADDFIEKPFSMDYLLWKIKNTLGVRDQWKEKYSRVITAAASEVKTESPDERFIKDLICIIEKSIDNPLLNVEYLAAEVHMSRANLYRKLQSIAGESPVNFIKKIRLQRATQLLEEGNLYISEIGYMTGFNNQKYFSKCFRKTYGVGPQEYAKQYKEKQAESVLESQPPIVFQTELDETSIARSKPNKS